MFLNDFFSSPSSYFGMINGFCFVQIFYTSLNFVVPTILSIIGIYFYIKERNT